MNPATTVSNPVCTTCLTPIAAGEAAVACPDCAAPYHAECWEENGGCGVYGCQNSPEVVPRSGLEIPVSFWGQTEKACPQCGKQIQAAAVRCRHCGAAFTSAQPQDRSSWDQHSARQSRLPAARTGVIWLFVLCAIPCLSPIGLLFGLIWYPVNRKDVQALPALYRALCIIGLIVAAIITVGLISLTWLYSAAKQG